MFTPTLFMKPIAPAVRSALSAYTRAVCNHPRWVFVIWLCIVLPCLSGLGKLSLSSDLRINFGPNNPQLAAYDLQRENYAAGEYTLIGVRALNPDSAGVLSAEGLQLIAKITELSWRLPGVTRVESVTNYPRVSASVDGLAVEEILSSTDMLPADANTLAAHIMAEPALLGRLIAPDKRIAGIALTTHFPDNDEQATSTHMQAVMQLRDEILREHPQFALHITGTNAVSHAFALAAVEDTRSLVPLMYAVFLALILILTGSFTFTLLMLGIMLLSSLLTLGLAGHAGMVLTAASLAAPHIITTLAIADGIHLISSASESDQARLERDAVRNALRRNMPALVLTTLTTMIGFLIANFADSPPLRDLGNLTALGAFIALALSTSLLPAALITLRTRIPRRQHRWLQRLCAMIGRLQIARPRVLVMFTGLFAVILSGLALRNIADDDFTRYFDKDVAYRIDAEALDGRLTGLHTLEFSVPAPEGIADPEYLRALEDFQKWWTQGPYADAVMHVSSVSTLFARMNRALHADDADYQQVPARKDEAAQYLLLYQLSLPYGQDIENRITQAQDASRFVVFLHGLTSSQTRKIIEQAQGWLASHHPRYATLATSPAVMYAYIAQRNIQAMLMQLPGAILLMALLFMLVLRSMRLGALSLVALALPVGVCFGLWALLSGVVNFTMAVVSGAVIGVVADDTIHLLASYKQARRQHAPGQAVQIAMRHVGPAVVATSLILSAGFAVLSQSLFLPNSGMAQLIVLAVLAALIINLLMILPLAYLLDRKARLAAPKSSALSSAA